jgi:ATP-dependent DNA helicase DinG
MCPPESGEHGIPLMSRELQAYLDRVDEAFAPQGDLARQRQGYAARPVQQAMARAVGETVAASGMLVAEAGTGTGKTYAYLVPALLAGGPVLISTGTRNLQDQLFRRDLPEVCKSLQIPLRLALLKGRANYVCLHHLKRNLQEGRFERREDIAVLRRIERFARVSASGDRSEAPGIPEESPAWARATSTRDNCLGQDCPELSQCFVFKARQAAQAADVLVVNHHLFCADLALRDEGISDLLPTVRTLVFDEAHQLPEVASQFFGRAVSSRQLIEFARDLLRAGLEEAADGSDWRLLAAELEGAVQTLRAQAPAGPGRRDLERLRHDGGFLSALEMLTQRLRAAVLTVQQAAERGRELARLGERGVELATRLERWWAGVSLDSNGTGASQAGSVRAAAPADGRSERAPTDPVPVAGSEGGREPAQSALASDESDGPSILWAEFSQVGVILHSTPLSLAASFRRHLQSTPRAWVFASATLAVNGRFDHFNASLGLSEARCERWDSPFDFKRQSLLLVPRECGDPAAADFPARVSALAWKLLCANRGRAFLLCTSLRMVDQLAQLLGSRVADAGLAGPGSRMELLVQGTASRSAQLERFREARAPILIGSASFWEGVDVVGDQLSLVLIDKLPFAPPDDPVLRARSDALRKEGGDPFNQLQVPAAALLLKQGVGRLIRSEQDRGLIAICDERLLTRSYGGTLLRSLPPMPVTRDSAAAIDWITRTPGAESTEQLPPTTPAIDLSGRF